LALALFTPALSRINPRSLARATKMEAGEELWAHSPRGERSRLVGGPGMQPALGKLWCQLCA